MDKNLGLSKIRNTSFLKKKGLDWFLSYSLLFIIFAGIVFINFIINKKSLVWMVDGYPQHYKALMMIRKFYTDFVKNLFDGLSIYNFNLGFGADTFNTLTYYGFFDPINSLSIFTPLKYTEYLYDFLIIFRFYLAGLSFIYLCLYFEQKKVYAVLGAFVYISSGYFFLYGTKHPFFLNAPIYLPLMISGLDQILKKKKPYVFIFGISCLSLSGFYFLYISSLLTFIYANVRFFELNKEKNGIIIKYFLEVLNVLKYYFIAIGISAFTILPNILMILSTKRGKNLHITYFLWNTDHFNKIFLVFDIQGKIALLSILFFTFVLGLIHYWKCRKGMFFLSIFSVIGIGISLIGVVLSGFMYFSDRWFFGTSLLLSYIFVEQFENLLNREHSKLITYALIFSNIGIFILYYLRIVKDTSIFSILVIDALYLILYLIKMKRHYRFPVVCILITILIFIKSFISFSTFTEEFYKHGLYKRLLLTSEGEFSRLYKNEESDYFRIDGLGMNVNESAIYDVKTPYMYWSLINQNISDLFEKIGNFNMNVLFSIRSMDNRSIISTLLSNKYQMISKNNDGVLPYGYEPMGEIIPGRFLYKNRNFLPFGFTYDNYVLYKDFKKLFSLDQESNMLDTIALKKDIKGIKKGETKNYYKEESFYFIEKGKNEFEIYPKVEGKKEVGSLTLPLIPKTLHPFIQANYGLFFCQIL